MKQSSLGLGRSTKYTRSREFHHEMYRVAPWSDPVAQIALFMPEGKRSRPPCPVESLQRIYCIQQWFTQNDPAMEEALHNVAAVSALAHAVRGTAGHVNDVVEHPLPVIKGQFGHVKVSYHGRVKNTAELHKLFALADLSMVGRRLSGYLA